MQQKKAIFAKINNDFLQMGKIRKRLKKIRIHNEGTNTLLYGAIALILIALILWFAIPTKIPFWIFVIVFGTVYGIVLNFYRCPIRYYESDDVEGIVVAPADGHIVVIEEIEETKYFNEKRMMVSIFMSLFNVHANWFPVEGTVKYVQHFNGNFHKAWLPKASEENEHTDTIITTPDGQDILVRQIAGAMARRVRNYANVGDECYIDEHLGFIKLGSRVDIFLPIDSEICVKMGQNTTGDKTVIAKLNVKKEA